MTYLLRFVERVSRFLAPIGMGAMLIMMTTVTFSVIGRATVDASIFGTVEIVELTGVILVALIIAYTQYGRQNITVSIVVDRMLPRLRGAFDIFTLILSLAFVAVLTWAHIIYTGEMVALSDKTRVFQINTLPFRIIWVFGCIVLCVVLVTQIIESLAKVVKKWTP